VTKSFPLTWLAEALREQGLTVRTVAGWKTRGRDGTFAPVGIMDHHTASSKTAGNVPALDTVTDGRADLPGPLCNVLVGRDGTCYVVAAGRCNHAGEGGPWKTVPVNSGNAYTAGVEIENNGIGEPWSDELLDAVARVNAAFLDHEGKGDSWVVGHKEWTDRKIDPSTSMSAIRKDTAAELAEEGAEDVSLKDELGLTDDAAKGIGHVLEGWWDYARKRDVVAEPIKNDVRRRTFEILQKIDAHASE
jgi:hypothetical protein